MTFILSPLMRFFVYTIHILPQPIKKWIGQGIGILWFDILRIRRQTAISNILKVFPNMTRTQATHMARTSMIHIGYTIVEFCSMPFHNKASIEKLITIEGGEILDEAFKKGHGVLLIPPHIGNGDLGTAALSYAGYKTHLISKVFKSKWLNDFWFQSRQKHGTQFIPPRRSSYEILKALKNNEMVIFVLDQYTGPPNGIPSQFFGHDTGTAMGPALFAQRSHAQVIPAYAYRKKFGEHVVKVLPPVPYKTEGLSKEELLSENTQRFSQAIEKMILEKPEQWMWIHRRWKKGW